MIPLADMPHHAERAAQLRAQVAEVEAELAAYGVVVAHELQHGGVRSSD